MASQPNIEAGSAFVRVHLKSENMQKFFNEWGKRASAFGAKLSAASRKAAVSAIVLSIPAIAGLRAFGKFSKEMAFVSTMLDNTSKHMEEFTKQVHKMSVQFAQSTETMSKGLFDILSAGFDASDAIRMLNVTSKSAVAGNTDVSNSTKAIIAVLNSYGLSADRATEVSDSLFQTVRFGVLTFEELAGHIGLVAPSAASAGVKLDEMGATLAVITRAGVETSHAIVALNNILKAFIAPTGAGAEFAKQLKEAGFAFDVSISGIKKAGFVRILEAIGRLPTEAIARLFPSIRSQRGILAIKAGLESLPLILAKFNNKAGATERAFQKMSETFGFFLDQLKSAGKMILTIFGEVIAGNIKNISKNVTKIATGVGNWIKENKKLIGTYVKIIGAIVIVGLALLVVSKILTLVAVISIVIKTAAVGWATAISALVVGVSAAGAGFLFIRNILGGIREEINKIADASKSIDSDAIAEAVVGAATGGGARAREREVMRRARIRRAGRPESPFVTHGNVPPFTQRDLDDVTKAFDAAEKKIDAFNNVVDELNANRKILAETTAGIIEDELLLKRVREGGQRGRGVDANIAFFSKEIVDLKQKEKDLKEKIRVSDIKTSEGLRLFQEASFRAAKRRLAAVKEQFKIDSKIAEKKKEELERARKIAEMAARATKFTRGSFAGFFHTRQQLFSSSESPQTKQTDLLGQIQINTKDTAKQLSEGITVKTN